MVSKDAPINPSHVTAAYFVPFLNPCNKHTFFNARTTEACVAM